VSGPQPSLRPTRAVDLLAAGLLGAGVTVLVHVARGNDTLTALPASIPVTVGILAVAELLAAANVRARLEGRPRTRPIMPITVARTAVFARASSLTAALVGGTWAVLLADRLSRVGDVNAATRDAVVAGAGLATAVVLILAALRLEGVCRASPPPPGGRDDPDG
jgi:hypothetical protein